MGEDVEPVAPEGHRRDGARRPKFVRPRGAVLGVVAVGGGLGAVARYGLSQALPTRAGHFPWGIFVINVCGCFLIGVLMVATKAGSPRSLARPFLGVGVLGGFTTFSAYAAEIHDLLRPGTVLIAFAYLAGTPLCALLGVSTAGWLTRWATGFARGAPETGKPPGPGEPS